MSVEELLKSEYSKGIKQGKAEGIEQGTRKILELTNRMIADGKVADISRLSADEEFLQEMLEAYNL